MIDSELEQIAEAAQALLEPGRRTARSTGTDVGRNWFELAKHGMTRVSSPTPLGGGEDPLYLGAILKALGRAAASAPLIETQVGASLLVAAGLANEMSIPPDSPISSALDPHLLCRSLGSRSHLPAMYTQPSDVLVVAILDPRRADVSVHAWYWDDLDVPIAPNLAGEPIARLDIAALARPRWSGSVTLEEAGWCAVVDSVGRSLMVAGAAERAVEQTIAHVGERRQFGRRLADFQSVQQTVAQMAGLASAASAAADASLSLVSRCTAAGAPSVTEELWLAAMATRIQCARSAAFVSRGAHQLHGALGTTQELGLHLVTTRLRAWSAHGPASEEVARELGNHAFAKSELWPFLTCGS